jgi:hypothetical protein
MMPRYDSPVKVWWILNMDGQRLIGAAGSATNSLALTGIRIETRMQAMTACQATLPNTAMVWVESGSGHAVIFLCWGFRCVVATMYTVLLDY